MIGLMLGKLNKKDSDKQQEFIKKKISDAIRPLFSILTCEMYLYTNAITTSVT